jgi:hypothetical protein
LGGDGTNMGARESAGIDAKLSPVDVDSQRSINHTVIAALDARSMPLPFSGRGVEE